MAESNAIRNNYARSVTLYDAPIVFKPLETKALPSDDMWLRYESKNRI